MRKMKRILKKDEEKKRKEDEKNKRRKIGKLKEKPKKISRKNSIKKS